ncbi:hypothetical protein [Lyngbya confervoides]|uniref:Uncharacterized protein n=1 Tax=Lyngbya confervoides BDU141951 TaxID=1574623 RepID=A0ABD4SYC9_9CYAN|nr:hypothetical protein [Lyngbya confervoides]MCM1981334.1 hypothetical protein [Lyngbya confervoides BDU141951]
MESVINTSHLPKTDDKNVLRKWLQELTDFTPQQIDTVIAEMEDQSPRSA